MTENPKVDWSRPLELMVSEKARFNVLYKHSDGTDPCYPHAVRVKFVRSDGVDLPATVYFTNDYGYIRGATGALVRNVPRTLDWEGKLVMTDEYFHEVHNKGRHMSAKPTVRWTRRDDLSGSYRVALSNGIIITVKDDGRGRSTGRQAFVNV